MVVKIHPEVTAVPERQLVTSVLGLVRHCS